MSLALVLSGGGARGAYEVGVLSYLCRPDGPLAGAAGGVGTCVDFICGTSVGAINGTFLASAADDPAPGVGRLVELWRQLSLTDVLGFDLFHARKLHRVLFGGRKGAGLFDAGPMGRIIRAEINYRRLARNIRERKLKGITVTATHMSTGRPTVFVDRSPGIDAPSGMPSVDVRPAHIMPYHVLASAAIPVVFPPVFIRSDLYCDGGLRLNTPLSPALRLGADKVLVIGMTTHAHETRPELVTGRFPGLPFLAGKVLDAFLLDHVNLDLEELDRVNAFLADGIAAYGPDFLDRTNAAAAARGAPSRRLVRSFTIRPSHDIGRLAAEFLRRERPKLQRSVGRTLLRFIDVGEGADAADLASYLLFDGQFASELIALGYSDAAARADELEAFLDA